MPRRLGLFMLAFMICMAAPCKGLSKPESVQQTALAFFAALEEGRLAEVQALALTYAQWESLSKRGLDKPAFEKEQQGFVRQLAAVLARGAKLTDLQLKDVLVLPAGKKRKTPVTLAVFHGSLFMPKETKRGQTLVFCFMLVDGHWRFWHRA